jgi:hypothetical protein
MIDRLKSIQENFKKLTENKEVKKEALPEKSYELIMKSENINEESNKCIVIDRVILKPSHPSFKKGSNFFGMLNIYYKIFETKEDYITNKDIPEKLIQIDLDVDMPDYVNSFLSGCFSQVNKKENGNIEGLKV